VGSRPGLLLLDNFEHLIVGGTEIVCALLERMRGLTLLATSRQRLGLDGEQEFPVGPLPVPDVPAGRRAGGPESIRVRGQDGQDASRETVLPSYPVHPVHPCELSRSPEYLMQFPGVQLFIDRAQAVRPDFQVTRRTAATIAALCDRLEGLPLALELVAARAGVLTPAQMLARMEQRFELSVTRRRDAAPRHRSLRAALDWSYHLLPPELQRFFVRLSIFRGGWTLAAAEVVCEEPKALEYLQQLRECSLVLCHEAGEEMRYRLLETLREYGAEQLDPPERASLVQRHAQYYLALAERAEACLISADQKPWLDRLEAELENLRAVLDWSESAAGAVEIGLRLGGALRWFWGRGGHLREGRERLSRLLAKAGEARTPERAKAQACAGAIAQALGAMEEARLLLTEALAIARECSASSEIAYSLRFLGHLAVFRGDYAEAGAFLEEGRSISQAVGNQWETADCLNLLGHVARYQGDYVTARSRFEETLAFLRGLGDRSGTATLLKNLSIVARYQEEYEAARALAEESLTIGRAMGDRPGIALALLTLGEVLEEQGDLGAARACYEECLAIRRELCIPYGVAWSLGLLGRVALAQGGTEEARSLYQESLEMRRELGDRRGIADCLEGLATLARAVGHFSQSVRLFGAAQTLREAIGSTAPPRERREQQQQLAALREAMEESSYLAEWNAGRALSWQQAAAEALSPIAIPA
jgi:predicted ATPase